ncbi:MAG: UvrD-helicase domain-containing protein [Bacteroidales bacterium]|nr:UvrD-helicase domain-containing protein [Bacteroidales bacterium]
MTSFLKDLTPEQYEAVTHGDGPLIVIAGAGSGKTRVLTYRVAYLISQGVRPDQIMALTFTNKAAEEMKQRIRQLVSSQNALQLWAGTFHSVFLRILRVEHKIIDFDKNFTIYDRDDSLQKIRKIIKELNLDNTVYKPSRILERISMAKTNLISYIDYFNHPTFSEQDRWEKIPETGTIYQIYQQQMRTSHAMDFDDILYFTYLLLKNHPEVRKKYGNKFRYILVDEYQDTNVLQYEILKLLTDYHKNICVVGDDAQSIYSFRGANIQNIFDFQKDFPGFTLVKLQQNFRSTKVILEAANHLIKQNRQQIPKNLWTIKEEGRPISLLQGLNEEDEAEKVVSHLFHYKMSYQRKHSDFAILYRTNAQSRAFEIALRKSNIPYKIYGSLSFYNRKEIKDLLAYFRVVINTDDEEALLRIINYPLRGIGETTIEKLVHFAREEKTSVWNILKKVEEKNFNAGTIDRLKKFVKLIETFRTLQFSSLYDLAYYIYEKSGMKEDIENLSKNEKVASIENIEELLNSISGFEQKFIFENNHAPTLLDYLSSVSLLTTSEMAPGEEEHDHVKLMTVHTAKGLEFPVVFVTGLEENLFPHYYGLENEPNKIEEERRLFYVALTRAQEKLFLSFARTRSIQGEIKIRKPSPFLEEIPLELFEKVNKYFSPADTTATLPNPKKNGQFQTPLYHIHPEEIPPADNVMPGMKVLHSHYGEGYVESTEGEGENKRAVVAFESAGKRVLLLKFAKLKIIS